jgi:hypothetical protein
VRSSTQTMINTDWGRRAALSPRRGGSRPGGARPRWRWPCR